MRVLLVFSLLAALAASGCVQSQTQSATSSPEFAALPTPRVEASPQIEPAPRAEPVPRAEPAPAAVSDQKVIVTPGETLAGKVERVNPNARFVVLSFPLGHLPRLDQVMPVYHQGLKIGEVKVSGPQLEENVVADLVSGEAQVGDEVRER